MGVHMPPSPMPQRGQRHAESAARTWKRRFRAHARRCRCARAARHRRPPSGGQDPPPGSRRFAVRLPDAGRPRAVLEIHFPGAPAGRCHRDDAARFPNVDSCLDGRNRRGPRDGGSRVGSRRARHRGRVHEIGPAGAPVRSHAGMERLCRIVRGRMDQDALNVDDVFMGLRPRTAVGRCDRNGRLVRIQIQLRQGDQGVRSTYEGDAMGQWEICPGLGASRAPASKPSADRGVHMRHRGACVSTAIESCTGHGVNP